MNAARPLPPCPVTLLAANDNASSTLGPRAQAALEHPLPFARATPRPPCRRWHTVDGERAFSSILVVEPGAGGPRWRMSVTPWGYQDDDRAELGWLLAHQLVAGLGEGPLSEELVGGTVFVRRALTAAERERLAVGSQCVELRQER